MFRNSKTSLPSSNHRVLRSHKNSEKGNLHILPKDKHQPTEKQKLRNESEKCVPKLVLSRVGNSDTYMSKLLFTEKNKKKYKKDNSKKVTFTDAINDSNENVDFSYKLSKEKNSSKIGKVYVADMSKLIEPRLFKDFCEAFSIDTEIRSPGNQVLEVRTQNNVEMTPMDKIKKSEVAVRNDDNEVSCSNIPASLPAQQRWKCAGDSYKLPGVENKMFYMSICRGNEAISIGDCVTFFSTDGRPFIGKIYRIWEASRKEIYINAIWFYRPEETTFIGDLPYSENALFQSYHNDDNNVQTILHQCLVVHLEEFKTIVANEPDKLHNNDLFYIAGYYDPIKGTVYVMKNE